MGELGCEGIDTWDNRVAVRYGECAAGKEVILHVDDQKRVSRTKIHVIKRTIFCNDRLIV